MGGIFIFLSVLKAQFDASEVLEPYLVSPDGSRENAPQG
jgi:hypothetical protein